MDKSFMAMKCFLNASFMVPHLLIDPTSKQLYRWKATPVWDPKNWRSSSDELLAVSPHAVSKYVRCSLTSPVP